MRNDIGTFYGVEGVESLQEQIRSSPKVYIKANLDFVSEK